MENPQQNRQIALKKQKNKIPAPSNLSPFCCRVLPLKPQETPNKSGLVLNNNNSEPGLTEENALKKNKNTWTQKRSLTNLDSLKKNKQIQTKSCKCGHLESHSARGREECLRCTGSFPIEEDCRSIYCENFFRKAPAWGLGFGVKPCWLLNYWFFPYFSCFLGVERSVWMCLMGWKEEKKGRKAGFDLVNDW